MAYEYRKLIGRIAEKVGTQAKFAELMGLSERTVSLKLNSKIGLKQEEISKACVILDIKPEEIPTYFFTEAVQY